MKLTTLRPWLGGLLLWSAAGLMAQTAPPTTPPASTTAAAVPAGPAYGLGELVNIVLTHNPTLQMSQRSREQAQAGIRTAGALPNPRLEFGDGRQRPSNGGSSGTVGAWGVSQMIENPWLRSARVDAAEQGLRSSEAQVVLEAHVSKYQEPQTSK
jgi:cobalt-zinc-cadmium efflux system outer membrane protein